jgi:hypothetical protein
MIVVANAEPLLDQIADHRPGPDPRLVARLHRPELDEDRQRFALFLCQLRGRALRDARPKPFDVIGVVPLEPSIHAAARDSTFCRNVSSLPAVDVGPNRTPSTPLGEVVLEVRLGDESVELLELRRATTRATDCLPSVGSSHDRFTMILG